MPITINCVIEYSQSIPCIQARTMIHQSPAAHNAVHDLTVQLVVPPTYVGLLMHVLEVEFGVDTR